MGTHPIFESDFDCLTDFSYGPSNLFIMVFEKFVSIGGVVFSEAHQKPRAVVNMTEAYAGTDMAKAAATKQRRANLTDFERYKLMRLKQARNRIVNQEVGKLRKQK